MSSKIISSIRFDSQSKEAAEFYCSIFPDSTINNIDPITTTFTLLKGYQFVWINGGPNFQPNPSISFSAWIIDKDLTKQIWDKISEWWTVMMEYGEYPRSPAYGRCNDKYGVSRQIMFDNRPERTTSAIVPSLMFTKELAWKAEEAINLYTKIFKNASIDFLWRYEEWGVDKAWTINHGEFTLEWQQFIAMDSALSHDFSFTEWVSLVINCKDQDEVDYYRDKLIADWWSESQCGRCKDKYGVSRQVIPVQLMQALGNPDQTKAQYAMKQMLKMKKIIIKDLS